MRRSILTLGTRDKTKALGPGKGYQSYKEKATKEKPSWGGMGTRNAGPPTRALNTFQAERNRLKFGPEEE